MERPDAISSRTLLKSGALTGLAAGEIVPAGLGRNHGVAYPGDDRFALAALRAFKLGSQVPFGPDHPSMGTVVQRDELATDRAAHAAVEHANAHRLIPRPARAPA